MNVVVLRALLEALIQIVEVELSVRVPRPCGTHDSRSNIQKLDSLMIKKYPNTVAKHSVMLEAGEKLVEYIDICHNNPVALTPLAVQRLMDVHKRHLVLMAPVGLFVPRHHLMLHLTHRALFSGIPRGTPLGAMKGTTEI